MRILVWAWEEAREKLDVASTWREIKELGKKHGLRMMVFAIIWELIEDVLFPYLSWRAGMPELIPIFLIIHFEPVTYPVAFWAFRMWDRLMGREPWTPDRTTYSTTSRGALKVLCYRVYALGVFAALTSTMPISLWVLSAYTVLMVLFSGVHESVWHDSPAYIREDGSVDPRRNIAKMLTYRLVSTIVMCGVFGAIMGGVPWVLVVMYQILAAAGYWLMESLWSRSTWGIVRTT